MAEADHVVSRETRARLDILIRELRTWQRAVNLVASSSLADIERRHVADSLQLLALAPSGQWIDIGSGGGFPGLVIAAADPHRPMTLIESDSRKCAFLAHAAAAMAVSVEVRHGRAEAELASSNHAAAVVSARAVAPLDRLLLYAQPLLARGAVGLFPKGRSFATELTTAQEHWHFHVDVIESRTDSDSRVLRITGFEGRRS